MSNSAVSSELLREVIREVVRDVLREIITEEVAAAMRSGEMKTSTPVVSVSSAPSKLQAHFFSRGALTERHVRAAEVDKTSITITKKVVVTPLARERAKTSGIEIIRIED